MIKINNIVIGADHRGFELKTFLIRELQKLEINVIDVGTNSIDSVDYPNFSRKMYDKMEADFYSKDNLDVNGILLCGSGIGMSIAANKVHQSIRAALIFNEKIAASAKVHNNANVACFASDHFSKEDILSWIKIFLNAQFEGGRHAARLKLVNELSC